MDKWRTTQQCKNQPVTCPVCRLEIEPAHGSSSFGQAMWTSNQLGSRSASSDWVGDHMDDLWRSYDQSQGHRLFQSIHDIDNSPFVGTRRHRFDWPGGSSSHDIRIGDSDQQGKSQYNSFTTGSLHSGNSPHSGPSSSNSPSSSDFECSMIEEPTRKSGRHLQISTNLGRTNDEQSSQHIVQSSTPTTLISEEGRMISVARAENLGQSARVSELHGAHKQHAQRQQKQILRQNIKLHATNEQHQAKERSPSPKKDHQHSTSPSAHRLKQHGAQMHRSHSPPQNHENK